MDREDLALSARLENSGFIALENDGVALSNRAPPSPKPRAEVQSNPLAMIVSIKFSVR